jgi:hypothetical protein
MQVGNVEVDVTEANVRPTHPVLRKVGAEIITVHPEYRARGLMPINSIEGMAERPDIIWIENKRDAKTNSAPRSYNHCFPRIGWEPDARINDIRPTPVRPKGACSRVSQIAHGHAYGSQNAESDVTHRVLLGPYGL